MDQIIVFKDGAVSECGTYRELLAQKGDFAEFLVQYLTDDAEEDPEMEKIKAELQQQLGKEEYTRQLSRVRTDSECVRDPNQRRGSDQSNHSLKESPTKSESPVKSPGKSLSPVKSPATAKPDGQKKNQQYQEEKTETGKVSWRIYLIYFKNMGFHFFGACVILFMCYQFFSAFSSIWLSFWADNELPFVSNETINELTQNNGTMKDIYLGVFGGIGFAQAISAIFASLLLYISTLTGAKVRMIGTLAYYRLITDPPTDELTDLLNVLSNPTCFSTYPLKH